MQQLENLPQINNFWDLLQYGWMVALYWVRDLFARLKTIEEKQAGTPTKEEVEARVDKELSRDIIKLDRVEGLLISMLQNKSSKTTDINL